MRLTPSAIGGRVWAPQGGDPNVPYAKLDRVAKAIYTQTDQ